MTTKTLVSREDAIKKGWLENKNIIIKPSPRGANMGVKDATHMAYFQIEHGSTFFTLPRTSRGDLVQVFNSDEEREYFEATLGLDLNTSKPGNFFESFDVKITKDSALMYKGIGFDASDPMDNLRIRVLKKNPTIAPSWEERMNKTEYRWALIDESKLAKEAEVEYDSIIEFGIYLGKLGGSLEKMKRVLKVYFSSINSSKKVQADATEQMIKAEFQKISKDITERDEFLKVVGSSLFDSKLFVLDAMDCNAISKDGADAYVFTGESKTYTFDEISRYIMQLETEQDDLYFKIQDRINKFNK